MIVLSFLGEVHGNILAAGAIKHRFWSLVLPSLALEFDLSRPRTKSHLRLLQQMPELVGWAHRRTSRVGDGGLLRLASKYADWSHRDPRGHHLEAQGLLWGYNILMARVIAAIVAGALWGALGGLILWVVVSALTH